MKIDIHTHTKKTKSGDPENRNISAEKFQEIIKETDVKVLAITNHNYFDLDQFVEFSEISKDTCQVWPGIELDIQENGKKAHLIVIVNPNNAKEFSEKTAELIDNTNPDNFTTTIEETVASYDNLDAIYIAHYYAKKPDLSDDKVEYLMDLVSYRRRVIKEATNSISAGIYISHGHKSIYGSDVQDWNEYQNLAEELPELRLPVESFEQFCLLLEKDESTIRTILNKKTKENITIEPFENDDPIELDIYNDINIIFGSKGTGKTEILRALSKYYNQNGKKTEVYESSNTHLKYEYDLKGNDFDIDIQTLGVDRCTEEIRSIKNATEKNITSLSKYLNYFSTEETNYISKQIKITNFTQSDESSLKRKFTEVSEIYNKVITFIEPTGRNNTLKEIIGDELFQELNSVLSKIVQKLKSESSSRFIKLKGLSLFNNFIKIFAKEVAKKTGKPEKPIKTGFKEYASNRIEIESNINIIAKNISQEIEPITEYVGNLGVKGELHCQTNLVIQKGKHSNSNYSPIEKVHKTPQKEVSEKLKDIQNYVYSKELFEKISELNAIDGSNTINSINDLVLFYKHFTLDGQKYTPSNGESSMVLLHNELKTDKEIYLIDEPEKSLGNDYINDVIVPLLKEHARLGRIIIVATHDANIAVRTLPFNSIYREHGIDGYFTYSGNPFSNNLVCRDEEKDDLDWKNISMKTLEGGREAFGERGKIYGNE